MAVALHRCLSAVFAKQGYCDSMQNRTIVGTLPTLGRIGGPIPVLGELRSLPTHCKAKTQRIKCADSPQASNIKQKIIKVRPWCSIATTKHKFEINGPNTHALNFAATWFCKTTIVRLKGDQSHWRGPFGGLGSLVLPNYVKIFFNSISLQIKKTKKNSAIA